MAGPARWVGPQQGCAVKGEWQGAAGVWARQGVMGRGVGVVIGGGAEVAVGSLAGLSFP